jgi:hypothetical protein
MQRRSAPYRLRLGVAVVLASLAFPAVASAHGIVGRADLPIPSWMFAWAATIVMFITFVALFRLWDRPHRRIPFRVLLRVPAPFEVLAGAVGIALFAIVAYAGIAGLQTFTSNLAPTFIYVIFWVGIPIVSAFVGDIWRPFNPWRAVARAGAWALARAGRDRPPLLGRYPERIGRWPAAVGLAGFAWLELVYPSKDDPRLLAVLALIYAAVQIGGMAAYGIETWTDRADGFSVYFSMIATLAPLRWRKRSLAVRWPLLGAREIEVVPGTAAVLCALIGSTSFDGFSNGKVWVKVAPQMEHAAEHLGFSTVGGYEVAGTIGLLFWIGFVGAFYNLGVWGMARAVEGDRRILAAQFLHTLVPIAFGYMLAHYFSLLVLQGQAMGYLISDPLGHGADYFGTSQFLVNYNLISFALVWYVQIVAIVAGHVGGLVLSHERGLVSFRSPRGMIRAQDWMLVVMVGFTCLALWILSAVTTTTI